MDRLHAMQVFTAIVDGGSLSAAGRRLAMPLATVSRKLADLEAHLGTRLVLRSTRQLSLTDAGRDYWAACSDILERVGEAERGATGAYAAVRGHLSVAAPIVFGRIHMAPLMAQFLALYPEVDAQLLLGDRFANLLDEHIDVALRIGALPDSSLVAKPVGQVWRVVCASPAYLARKGVPQRPVDLAGHEVVSFTGLASAGAWRLVAQRGSAPENIAVHARLSVNTAEAAMAAAQAGLGLTQVLSYQAASALRSGALVEVLQAHRPPSSPVNIVHAGQGRLPMKTRAFIDFTAQQLQQRLLADESAATVGAQPAAQARRARGKRQTQDRHVPQHQDPV